MSKHELRQDDAAAFLGLTVAELLELAGDGQIPNAILDLRGWRFPRKGLEQFLTRRGVPRQDAA